MFLLTPTLSGSDIVYAVGMAAMAILEFFHFFSSRLSSEQSDPEKGFLTKSIWLRNGHADSVGVNAS